MEQFGKSIESGSDRGVYRSEMLLSDKEVESLQKQLEKRKESWEQGEASEVSRISFSDLKNPEDLLFLKRYFEHDLNEKDIQNYYQMMGNGVSHSSQGELCALARGQVMRDHARRKYGEETPKSFGHYNLH